jgi:hypothetical protein
VIPYFKAFMQLYRYSVIHNKLTVPAGSNNN